MIGALAGDIIGSRFEWNNIKSKEFVLFTEDCFFTDDSVLSIATAEAMQGDGDYAAAYRRWGQRYPAAGYGGRFAGWLRDNGAGPYNSYGNGSAMRVAPAGFAARTLEEVCALARETAVVTHNHPEGVKGAEATAAAIFIARRGGGKDTIREYVTATFGYDLERTLDGIRPTFRFDESCQGTVPEAIIAVLESTDFEDAIRNAISLGGDSDTLACIAGGIAEALYGAVPEWIRTEVLERLAPEMVRIVNDFSAWCLQRATAS